MSSRRLTNRSLSSDGRSFYRGSDFGSQNRTTGCRTYLSSVRSESRSTLCSVMAQLTEEVQPTFESTLKSKAVSEDTNVKFSCVVSGHPVPEVTWYKDDIQLDRYCGLPKYEISRDDKTHTLQIYNCTLDDAAIYQASAQNSRGIVSCSGVLEVGTMSEYKIHQNYFAKLKQRNEDRRREQEEPRKTEEENIPEATEAIRMSSPERVQRKHRSAIEASRRAGSPSEESVMEVDTLSQTPPLEDRLAAPDQVSAAASVQSVLTAEIITHKDKGSEGLTNIHESVHNESSKQLKKPKITTAATERNQASGNETSIEKMEVQNKVAESDIKTNKKQPEKVNKSGSEESKRAHDAWITSGTESRNKTGVTDTKTKEKQSVNLNKSASEELKRTQFGLLTRTKNKTDTTDTRKSEKQSLNLNKSTSGESKTDQSAEASVTESRNKMEIKDTKTNEKLSVNKSALEESKRGQGAKLTLVTESRNKLFITDTRKSEKQPVNANKGISEGSKRPQDAQIDSVAESKNKIETKTNEKKQLKTNKNALEESKIHPDVCMASVTESRNKMDIIDTNKDEKQSLNSNKSVPVESKKASGAQLTSVTESSNKIVITDTKTNEKLPVKVIKNVSKINQSALSTSVTESKNKMGITDTGKTEKQSINVNISLSEESKKVPGTQSISITESKAKVDMKTKKAEKLLENMKERASESKQAQKPLADQKQPAVSISTTTQTNKVVKSAEVTKPSGKGTSHFKAPDTIQNCNPIFINNKLKDSDDHGNSPAGTCVRILPNSCGGNDVNMDTGEKNVSARSLRDLAAGDTQTEPSELTTHEDIPPKCKEVAVELKEQATLIDEVTVSVTETLSSCHLASQEQELRAGDQSVASTKSSALVTRHQNTQLSEKISSGHVSNELQDGQVTTATSSSLGDKTLSKDSKAENKLIKEPDNPKSETKPPSMSLNNMEGNKMKNISTDIHAQNTFEENSTSHSKHSKHQVIVTEFVQVCLTNSNVVQPKTMNGSSVSDLQMKDTNIEQIQIAKKDKQEKSNLTTSEAISTHHKQSRSAKKGTDDSTFLSQHSNILPTEFTIPAIYITDVDNIAQNSTEKPHTVDKIEIRNEPNAATSNVRHSNTFNQISDSTDNTNKAAAVKSEGQPSEINKNDQEQSQENVAPDIKLTERTMQHCSADNSITNLSDLTETSHLAKTDLNLRNDSFIKQLKAAALEISSQPSIKSNAAQHIKSKDNFKYGKKTDIQPDAGKETVPPKTTDDKVFSSTAAQSELSTRTKTETSERGVTTCLEKAYQEDKLPLKSQPASQSQSVCNLPLMTSLETHSPRLSRRTVPTDPPKPAGNENIKPKSTEKDKENQFKVPQVIRKIRPEVFDASGHLKLWCQFFNIVSDSTIRWYKDEVEIAEINRSAGDETQLCLAIIQMSKRDCGVYKCIITNEYGKDSTECPLGTDVLSNMFLREELHEVGEEIEMTPLIFSKGLADPGCWGSKFYGRITTEEAQVGLGCEHKTRRLKVIYGLDPVFESGSSCFMKVRSPIAYESREETVLAERNLQITKQDCRIQNMAREYFKIFATETRVIESFGAALEVIPLYFTYFPASSIPYATVEAELKGVYLRYCALDRFGSLVFNEKSEVGQKCSALQHWIHQWTNGNVLFSRLEGVDTILTNIGVAVRSKGYQGFPCEANPRVFEQFHIQHQCNYFCGLLNLKPLKAPETLQTPTRSKGSSSPMLQRRAAPGSSSPQTPRKTTKSPKVSRKQNPPTST